MSGSTSDDQAHKHQKNTSHRHVEVRIWNGIIAAPYKSIWCPDCSTSYIKRELEAVLNAEKTWLVRPSHMVFISTCGDTVGTAFSAGEPRDLEGIKMMVVHCHERGGAVWLRISRGPVPVFLWVVPALFVFTIAVLGFYDGHKWAQHVFFGLCGKGHVFSGLFIFMLTVQKGKLWLGSW